MRFTARILCITTLWMTLACDHTPGGEDHWDTSEPMDVDITMDTSDVEDTGPVDPDEPLAEHDLCGLEWEGPDNTACPIQAADDFRDCDGEAGAVFNGSFCSEVQSCACPGPLCAAFDSLEECATRCAAEGWCRPEAMPEHFPGGICTDETCWAQIAHLVSCVHGEDDPTLLLEALLDEQTVICHEYDGPPANESCRMCEGFPPNIPHADWCCRHSPKDLGAPFDETYLLDLCRLSLLQRLDAAWCIYFE